MATTNQTQKALKDASLHFGIIGALAFFVFILIFGKDWTSRYDYLQYLLPLPVVVLLIARRFPLLGGFLLAAMGIGVVIFDFRFSPSLPGQIAGRGLGYSALFVTLPLIISGIFYLVLWKKS